MLQFSLTPFGHVLVFVASLHIFVAFFSHMFCHSLPLSCLFLAGLKCCLVLAHFLQLSCHFPTTFLRVWKVALFKPADTCRFTWQLFSISLWICLVWFLCFLYSCIHKIVSARSASPCCFGSNLEAPVDSVCLTSHLFGSSPPNRLAKKLTCLVQASLCSSLAQEAPSPGNSMTGIIVSSQQRMEIAFAVRPVRGPGLGPGRAGPAATWYFAFILDILDISWVYLYILEFFGNMFGMFLV